MPRHSGSIPYCLGFREPGRAAEEDQVCGPADHTPLCPHHIGIETTGVFGPEALAFFKELGRHLRARSGNPLSFSHLLQQIGVTIQRGNTAAVLGIAPGHGLEWKSDCIVRHNV